jgi:hypothetical protein
MLLVGRSGSPGAHAGGVKAAPCEIVLKSSQPAFAREVIAWRLYDQILPFRSGPIQLFAVTAQAILFVHNLACLRGPAKRLCGNQ